jgi:hypothetical protein
MLMLAIVVPERITVPVACLVAPMVESGALNVTVAADV